MKILPTLLVSLLVAFGAVLFVGPQFVLADGVVIRPYEDRWEYLGESGQQAFINYDNGLQKMIVSVGFEGDDSSGMVWLFPVPADPNKVAINVISNLPNLHGDEISGKAKSNLDATRTWLQISQAYPIPFVMTSMMSGARSSGGYNTIGATGFDQKAEQDVVVYEHLEKEGITSEIITAKTANGLYDYLKSKGLQIESGSILVLDSYIGKEYSFVASWISSVSKPTISVQDIENKLYIYFAYDSRYPKFLQLVGGLYQKYPDFYAASNPPDYLKSQQGAVVFQELIQAIQNDPSIVADTWDKGLSNQKGVFVTFPTNEIYFPLLPTSVYGSKTVPATIRVMGFVSPKIFRDITSYTKIEYYIERYASIGEGLENFYKRQNEETKYTKIEINAPSKFLTDDLWIQNIAPTRTHYSLFVVQHPAITTIILLVLSSLITGLLVGWLIFKGLRKNIPKLCIIGLSNALSIFGLLIVTVLVGTKEKIGSADMVLAEIKQRGYFWKRKLAAILLLADLPFLVVSILAAPYLIEALMNFFREGGGYFGASEPFIVVLVSVAVLVFSLIIKRIRKDDRGLFSQLKATGYSSWSFQLKDRAKIAFVPIFSVSFLIVSWLLVKFVELVV